MTTTDIAIHQTTIAEKKDWSLTMAESSLLPKAYQKQPANLFLAAEYADELGIGRMNALTGIHVIDGKPSLSSSLMAALVRRAGHTLRVTGDGTSATAQLIRADDPDFTFSATWDMRRAQHAGLTGKAVWKSYPGAMLKARAISEVIREGASEVLAGILYVPEEISDTDPDVQGTEPVKMQRGKRKQTVKVEQVTEPEQPTIDATTGEVLDAEVQS